MNGIRFGEKHSFDDFGLILNHVDIGMPEIKTETVDVPGMDGSLDLTETLTDDIHYSNRLLSCTFTVLESANRWHMIRSEISNYMHGREMQVILDEDDSYFYQGRCKINQFQSDEVVGIMVIDVEAHPYKYDRIASGEDWLWDCFSFVDGIIYNNNFAVSGTYKAKLLNRRKRVCPVFTSSAAMTVTFGGKNYNLAKGVSQVIDIQLIEGENEITFTGSGTVSVEYRGGSL